MLISELKDNYPELILEFEDNIRLKAIWRGKLTKSFIYWLCDKLEFEKYDTSKHAIWHGEVTKQFIRWLREKIKYKDGFICKDPTCPNYGKDFGSKKSLSTHIQWHDKDRKKFN